MLRLEVTMRKLPKGVYLQPSGTYKTASWNGSKLEYFGTYDTPEEADYRLAIGSNGHHWNGMEDGPYFGFVYRITHRATGKMYIGKKQLFRWVGPRGGYKCTDRTCEDWDPKAWAANDWELYTGSSIPLNNEIAEGNVWDYKFEVLKMCRTKLHLFVTEVKYQIEEDVLDALDDNGEYKYYNENIAGCDFRAPFKKSEVAIQKEQVMEEVREYYLKPRICSKCSSVIPYGQESCSCQEVIKKDKGGFSDVR
jgi:hypothetical protein